jgi:hypothetical protein
LPGLDGIPTVRNFTFSDIRVTDVPVLVLADEIHPDKPLDGFVLTNLTGTCQKGIVLANMKNVVLRKIEVTGFAGPLISIDHVTGSGLAGAAPLEPLKVPDPIPAAAKPYMLGQ